MTLLYIQDLRLLRRLDEVHLQEGLEVQVGHLILVRHAEEPNGDECSDGGFRADRPCPSCASCRLSGLCWLPSEPCSQLP